MSRYRSVAPPTEATLVKFFARVEKYAGGCWVWTGALTGTGGYGYFYHRGDHRAHRVSYVWAHGPTDDDLHHTCGNSLCVNPDHLVPAEGQFHHPGSEHNRSRAYYERHRDEILAKLRDRPKVQYEPRPCERCGTEFTPMRSTGRRCENCRGMTREERRDYMRQRRAAAREGTGMKPQ